MGSRPSEKLVDKVLGNDELKEVVTTEYYARLGRHFVTYLCIMDGRIPEEDQGARAAPSQEKLMQAISNFEQYGDGVATLPRHLRADRVTQMAVQIGIDPAELLSIWEWWQVCGHKVNQT